jgi:hypothetical protein
MNAAGADDFRPLLLRIYATCLDNRVMRRQQNTRTGQYLNYNRLHSKNGPHLIYT